MKLKRRTIIIILLLLLASVCVQCNFFLCLTLVAFVVIVDRCSVNMYDNILFLLFLAAFYIFLVGGQVAQDFFGYAMEFEYSPEEYDYLNSSILISVVSIAIGYFASYRVSRKRRNFSIEDKFLLKTDSFRQWALISFYILTLPWFIVLAEQIMVVQRGRYLDYYNYTSALPRIVNDFADLCPYALCFFFATYPSKKKAAIPSLIVFIYAVLSILVGRRMYFVVYTLMLFGYAILRSRGEEKWITKRRLILLALLTPAVIIFLYSYRYIRYGKDVVATNNLEAFIGFFSQQGFTANLIPLGRRYVNELGNDIYSFYNTIKALRLSPVSRYILGLNYRENYYGSRQYMALNSGSYARIISYLVMGNKYLYGYGYGSCYVAELLHDFGYIGLVLGNIWNGYLIGRVLVLDENRIMLNAIALAIFLRMLMLPRYNFDYSIAVLYSIEFWMYVAALIGINLLTARNLKRAA